MNISISVVIPCYNCSETIGQCVESVVNQKQKVKEIILINDGSSDSTLEVLHKIKSSYQDILIDFVIIDQVNQGPSVARNKGLAVAKGNWIAFLDSDDMWIEDKLDIQLAIIKSYPNALILGGPSGNWQAKKKKLSVVRFSQLCFKNFFVTPSTMVKKDVIRELRFNENQKYSEDYRFFLELLATDKKKYFGVSTNFPLSMNIHGKRSYGDKGLSSNIFKMQKGELSNFRQLYKERKLSFVMYSVVVVFSNCKFFRRCIITNICN